MIVRNEARQIGRLIASIRHIADYYVICDTGSTDDTIDVIRSLDCSATVFSAEWVNFAHNRNLALKCAIDLHPDAYILCLDADMVFVGDVKSYIARTDADVYMLSQGTHAFQYYNPRIFRASLGVAVKCPTHEYYDIPHTARIEYVDPAIANIVDMGDGGHKHDKFARDLRLLTDYISSPIDAYDFYRCLFYRGNTHYDIGDYECAIRDYELYIKSKPLKDEEYFYTLYRCGCAYRHIGRDRDALYYWELAHNTRPHRREPLFAIAQMHIDASNNVLAYEALANTRQLAYPLNDQLFIHKDIYDYLADYEYVKMAHIWRETPHSTPVPETNNDVCVMFGKTLFYSGIGFDALLWTYAKYVQVMPYKTHQLEFNLQSGLHASTPSIAKVGESYVINVRVVNYSIDRETQRYDAPIAVATRNIRIDCDSPMVLPRMSVGVDCRMLDEDTSISLAFGTIYSGVEDIKLVDGVFAGTCARDGLIRMVSGRYENPLTYEVLDGRQECEKNWAPFKRDGAIEFVYKWHPLTIRHADGTMEEKTWLYPSFYTYMRGSTNGIERDGELWFMTHLVGSDAGKRCYFHMLCTFDVATLRPRRYTLPYKLGNVANDIEFACGIEWFGDNIIVGFSEYDACAKLGLIDVDRLQWFQIETDE